MTIRAVMLALPLALLAGCATAPRTTYHYDGTGDYYTGVTPGADVVLSASPSWGHGYPGWGYGGWAGGGFGYGYGSPWWYGGYGYGYGGWPWWNWRPIVVHPPKPEGPRLSRNAQRRELPTQRGDVDVAPKRTDALPSSRYAPQRAASVPRATDAIKAAPRFETQRAPARMPSAAPVRVAPPLAPPRAAPSFERAAPPARSASKRE